MTNQADADEELAWEQSLASKRASAVAILRNQAGEVLLLKTTYLDTWLLPGGMVEERESQTEAVKREVQEELSFQPDSEPKLKCVQYARPPQPYLDFVHFVFDWGVLDDAAIARIQLQEEEIVEFRFVETGAVDRLVDPALARRIKLALAAETVNYDEYDYASGMSA